MTQFWIYVAGLIVLAMAFIAVPLLRSRYKTGINADELNLSVFRQQLAELDSDLEAGILDQARYDAAKKDLEKELLSDVSGETPESTAQIPKGARWMALSALLVPLVAVLFYQTLGSPEIIQRLSGQPTSTGGDAPRHAQAQGMEGMPPLEELVGKLAAKLEQEPNNPQGWVMLGRSYMALNQHARAIEAFDRAMQLDSENVGLLLAYAEAIAASSGNNFTGQAAVLVEKAYSLEPENPNALWMSGIAAYQKGDYPSALDRWVKVQSMLTPQSSELEAVNSAIDDVRQQLGLAPSEPVLPAIAQAGIASSSQTSGETRGGNTSEGVEVNVSLSPVANVSPNRSSPQSSLVLSEI